MCTKTKTGRDRQRHGGRTHRGRDPGARRRRISSTSPCSAMSRTATTTASCSRACSTVSQSRSEIFLNPLEWYEDNNIRLHAGVRAAGICAGSRQVFGEDGRAEEYDKLIIATGSSAYLPPIDGLTAADGESKPGVFVFRSLDDCHKHRCVHAKGKNEGRRDRRRTAGPGSSARSCRISASKCTSCIEAVT